MGIFDPKAKEDDVRREISRLSGENALLRQAVVLLIRHSSDRMQLLEELQQDEAVLRSRAREAQLHPVWMSAMRETLESVVRMAQP
jgi:hypothetical protein